MMVDVIRQWLTRTMSKVNNAIDGIRQYSQRRWCTPERQIIMTIFDSDNGALQQHQRSEFRSQGVEGRKMEVGKRQSKGNILREGHLSYPACRGYPRLRDFLRVPVFYLFKIPHFSP